MEEKLAVYKQRGDAEIWYFHPYVKTLLRWIRQLDGSYVDSVLTTTTISPIGHPDVKVDLDALFA